MLTEEPPGRQDGASVAGRTGNSVVSLLDLDPDLGLGLDARDRHAARHRALARVVTLRSGAWNPDLTIPAAEAQRPGREWLGLYVVQGLITRRVIVGDRSSCEVLGTGDILRPWDSTDVSDEAALPYRIEWLLGGPTMLALLDARFARQIAPWPSLNNQIITRMARRIGYLALTQAVSHSPSVDDRLPAVFWLLAQRWGTMTPDGARIDLPFTHQLLGILVGARRPTVSIALKRLNDSGILIRLRRDRWLLTTAAIERLMALEPAAPTLGAPGHNGYPRIVIEPA